MDPTQTKKLINGALLAGGGVGLLGALYDLIRSNTREKKSLEGQGTLRLSLPEPGAGLPKRATSSELVTAAVGSVGAAALVGKLYRMYRQKMLKQETEDSNQAYLNSLMETPEAVNKSASWLWEMIKDSPRDAFILPALAGGVGTYGILRHAFPDNPAEADSEKNRPKKIVIDGYGTVIADGPGDGPLGEGKKASVPSLEFEPSLDDCVKSAAELFLTLCEEDLRGQESCKEASLLPLLGGLWIQDRAAMEKAAREDLEGTIFHAGSGKEVWEESDVFAKRAAAEGLLGSKLLGPSVASLLIAELDDANPGMAKTAAWVAMDRPDLEALLTKYGSTWVGVVGSAAAEHAGKCGYKSASLAEFAGKNMNTLDITSSPEDVNGEVNTADPVYRGKVDPIDKFLAGSN